MSTLLDVVTPRRLVTTAVIALAALATIVGFQDTRTTTAIPCGQPSGPIVKLFPCPGDSDLNQGVIGVAMAPGWQVDLSVDGTAIPRDQIIIEGTSYYFQPVPDSVLGALKPGAHTAKIIYYQDLATEASGSQYAWSFTTH